MRSLALAFAMPLCLLAQVPRYTVKALTSGVASESISGIALDASGNLFISYSLATGLVQKVTPSGIISTIAGGSAQDLSRPNGLAVDASGNLLIADTGNNRIRKVTPGGTATTVAVGSGTSDALNAPTDVAVDASGNLYIADSGNNRVRKLTPTGSISTVADSSAGLSRPTSVAVNSAGDLFISDFNHNRIRKLSASGVMTTVAGNGVAAYLGDGGPATAASLNRSQTGTLHIAVDSSGTLYICDSGAGRLRAVTTDGKINTLALAFVNGILQPGADGVASSTSPADPVAVATASGGKLYVGQTGIVSLLTPTGATFAPLPSVAERFSATAFGGFTAVAPGSWIEIYGSYLAPDTRSWAGTDFNGTAAPTTLDGVSLTIGGQPAFLGYISPGQINAQVPAGLGSGAQSIIVSVGSLKSQAYEVFVNQEEPGLLAPSAFEINGTPYVAALFPDAATFVLPVGAISGVASRPAKSGDTIVLYGVGFGPVLPSIPPGQIAQAANSLSSSFHIFFGSIEGSVAYSGLAPSYVGLYQFNVVVPKLSVTGNVPLTFTLGGMPGAQQLFIAIQ